MSHWHSSGRSRKQAQCKVVVLPMQRSGSSSSCVVNAPLSVINRTAQDKKLVHFEGWKSCFASAITSGLHKCRRAWSNQNDTAYGRNGYSRDSAASSSLLKMSSAAKLSRQQCVRQILAMYKSARSSSTWY